MKSATNLGYLALTLALIFGIAGSSSLKGQDTAAASVVPRLIKFSGVMTPSGAPNATANRAPASIVTATFSLYQFPEGGTPLWSESQKVQLDEQGHYAVDLGATNPEGLPLDLFTSGKALWLGVLPQVSGAGELPRVLLVAVPYALKASDADTLGGKPASAYALAGAPAVVEVPGSSANLTPTGAGRAASEQPLTGCSSITTTSATTSNTVPKFTTSCAVGKSLIRDNGTGVAIGGTAAPAGLFDVQFNSTATSGTIQGQRVLATLTPASASSAISYGLFANTQLATGNHQNFTGDIFASSSELDHYGTGILGTGIGASGIAFNRAAGTISNAYGLYSIVANIGSGKITNGYGLYVYPATNLGGGTFSNYTGVYIGTPSAVAGAYGLYSAGGKNYFAGNVGIGTPTPGANLEVNGTTKFDGLVTFHSGQTFPGAGVGTITGITTSSPLTGSGTSGSVGLGLNTTTLETTLNSVYAQLGAANTFTVGQTIDGTTTVTGSSIAGTMLNVYNSGGTAYSTAIYATNAGSYGTGVYGASASGGYAVEGSGTQSAGAIGVLGTLGSISNTFETLNSSDGYDTGVWADAPDGQTSALIATADTAYAGIFENNSASYSTLYVHNGGSAGLGAAARPLASVLRAEGSEGVCGINQTGSLACTGQVKAVIATQNGNHQLETYSVQSAENWLEDYGSGQLVNGSVTVRLDSAFADTVNTGVDFHVFLTPGGDCQGLYVTNKTATSFAVHELGGGAASVSFDYKIVAKRRGHENERLVDVTERMALEANAAHAKPLAKPLPRRMVRPGNRPATPVAQAVKSPARP